MITNSPDIMILGIGCTLYSDEGFGVQVVKKLEKLYEFPDNVSIVDGGVPGTILLDVISQPDYLIVVDAIRDKGKPGDIYRLEGDAIPERIRAKNSLHQVDFLEALTLCQVLDKVPETVILGVEPMDIETLSIELTSATAARVNDLIGMVLKELDRLGFTIRKGQSGMCLAIPSKIVEINEGMATIDVDGVKRKASLLLLDEVNIGEYVIVHAGFAIHKIDEKDAMESLQLLKEAAALADRINEDQ